MRIYTLAQDMIFVILALISAIALIGQHTIISSVFFILAILFISFEHNIVKYVKSA